MGKQMNDEMRKKAHEWITAYTERVMREMRYMRLRPDEGDMLAAWQAATENALDDARAELRKLTFSPCSLHKEIIALLTVTFYIITDEHGYQGPYNTYEEAVRERNYQEYGDIIARIGYRDFKVKPYE